MLSRPTQPKFEIKEGGHRTCFLNNLLRVSKNSTCVSCVSKIWPLQDPSFRMGKRSPLVKVLDLFMRVWCLTSLIYLFVSRLSQPVTHGMSKLKIRAKPAKETKRSVYCLVWSQEFCRFESPVQEVHTVDDHWSQHVREIFSSALCKLFGKHFFLKGTLSWVDMHRIQECKNTFKSYTLCK